MAVATMPSIAAAEPDSSSSSSSSGSSPSSSSASSNSAPSSSSSDFASTSSPSGLSSPPSSPGSVTSSQNRNGQFQSVYYVGTQSERWCRTCLNLKAEERRLCWRQLIVLHRGQGRILNDVFRP
jgi:hypothetical protein